MNKHEPGIDNGIDGSRFLRDMGWYLLGTVIPMAAGFIRTPVFTRYFTPEEYGYLGIVTITFTYLSVAIYSWLASCLWRYYNYYKRKGSLDALYSNILLLFLISSLLLGAISAVWAGLSEMALVRNLVLLSLARFLIAEIVSLILITLRLEGKALEYNLYHSSRAVFSLGLLLILTFGYSMRIEAVIISTFAVDLVILLLLLLLKKKRIPVRTGFISKEVIKQLLIFGSAGLVANLSLLILTSSDRYIIALFWDMADVGIYNQVYNISQLSIMALVTVYFNTINPTLNRELEFNFRGSLNLINDYIRILLLFGLPVTVLASLYSRELSFILLGQDFREGFVIMPFIFFSAFLYGISLFPEARLKFSNRLKAIAFAVLLSGALNIALNFVWVPIQGYPAAAYTTLISYAILLIIYFLNTDIRFFSYRSNYRYFAVPVLVLAAEVIIALLIRRWYNPGLLLSFAEGLLFLMIYLLAVRRKIRNLDLHHLVR